MDPPESGFVELGFYGASAFGKEYPGWHLLLSNNCGVQRIGSRGSIQGDIFN